MESHTKASRPRGRPRSQETKQAILQAACDLAAERGYSNVTLLDVATRAGTGRQTIYRWWPTLVDLYLEVIDEQVKAISAPQFLSADLEGYLSNIFAFMRGPAGVVTTGLLSDCHKESVELKLRPLIAIRLRMLTSAVERFAAERRGAFAVPPALIAETLAGAMWYRVLHQNAPLDDAFAHELTKLAAALLQPQPFTS